MKEVYLAGPISGLTYDGCTEWRDSVVQQLADVGIKGLSPMRAKSFLKKLADAKISSTGEEYKNLGILAQQKSIMTRDHYDATTCDVLLVNLLGAKTPSLGTVMEIAWAYTWQTPIVVAMEKTGNPHEHMMILEAIGFRVESLEEAVDIVKAILS